MWGPAEGTVKIVGPSVVGADDWTMQLFGSINQHHTAMTAYILEYINFVILIANQK